jgi:hypothetical protein
MTVETLDNRKTDESRSVEVLLESHFQKVDCYRYNAGSLRLCVFDERFRGRSEADRQALVEQLLKTLPESTQDDLFFILLLAPGEERDPKNSLLYQEFIDPTPSRL